MSSHTFLSWINMKKSTALKCRICVPITVLVFVRILYFSKHTDVWTWCIWIWLDHYCDVLMRAMAFQITSLVIVYSTVYSGADQRKHQSSASLAFLRGIHRWPMNSPHNWPVTRKKFPFNDVTMINSIWMYRFIKFGGFVLVFIYPTAVYIVRTFPLIQTLGK